MLPTSTASRELQALYSQEYHRLLRLAVLLCGQVEVAEDLVHDAFMGLWRRFVELAEPHAQQRYLRTSVVNGARSVLRRRRTAHKYLAELVAPSQPAADHRLLIAARDRQLIIALNGLPQRQREVLVLRHWAVLFAEIAEELGITVGAATATASRAIHRLRQHLKDMP